MCFLELSFDFASDSNGSDPPVNVRKFYTRFAIINRAQLATVVWAEVVLNVHSAKQKYRGMFETQKSGNKTNSRETGLNIRTHASPKAG